MKHFDSDTFLSVVSKLKCEEKTKSLIPEFRIVLVKAIWEGRVDESLLKAFDEIAAY